VVNIGSKILYQVVKTGPEDYKDIFMKLGIEMILEVFDQILSESFSDSSITLDRTEVKTILLLI
jgi:hypothetical protein